MTSPSKRQCDDDEAAPPEVPSSMLDTVNSIRQFEQRSKADPVPRDQLIELYSKLYREIVKNRFHIPADARRSLSECMRGIEKAFDIGILELIHEEPEE